MLSEITSSYYFIQQYAPKVITLGAYLLDVCVFTFYLHIIFLVVPSLIFTTFRPFCGELILCPLTL